MPQAIKYQDTTVDAAKSVAEIVALVQRYGASRLELQWDATGQTTGVRFALRSPELGEVPVRLVAATDTIRGILDRARPFRRRYNWTQEQWEQAQATQAHRIAWRQMRDFIEQALLAVETGLFPVVSAFMAHVEVWDDEGCEVVTMAELAHRRMQLAPGGQALRLLPPAR